MKNNCLNTGLAIPIRDQEAETIPRALVEIVVAVFGSPGSIPTEYASKFTGEFMRQLCRQLKISKIIAILFRPHNNTNIEKTHVIITEYLRHFICKDQNNWDTLWPTATFGYNTTPQTRNKCCPFELVFGREPCIPGLLQSHSQYPEYRKGGR